jgi:hypothetical protein
MLFVVPPREAGQIQPVAHGLPVNVDIFFFVKFRWTPSNRFLSLTSQGHQITLPKFQNQTNMSCIIFEQVTL